MDVKYMITNIGCSGQISTRRKVKVWAMRDYNRESRSVTPEKHPRDVYVLETRLEALLCCLRARRCWTLIPTTGWIETNFAKRTVKSKEPRRLETALEAPSECTLRCLRSKLCWRLKGEERAPQREHI